MSERGTHCELSRTGHPSSRAAGSSLGILCAAGLTGSSEQSSRQPLCNPRPLAGQHWPGLASPDLIQRPVLAFDPASDPTSDREASTGLI